MLRRLQVAAREGRTWGVLWRRPGPARQRHGGAAAARAVAAAGTARGARAETPRRRTCATDRARSCARARCAALSAARRHSGVSGRTSTSASHAASTASRPRPTGKARRDKFRLYARRLDPTAIDAVACLLLPSLPLDVFARAAPDTSRGRSSSRAAATIRASSPRMLRARGRHSPRPADLRGARVRTRRRRCAIATSRAEEAALAEMATLLLAFTPQREHRAARTPSSPRSKAACGCSADCAPLLDSCSRRRERAVTARARAGTYADRRTAARARRPSQPVLDARLAGALAPLPLALLDFEAGTLATLKAAGVTTFGAAQALPRAGLARRFDQRVVDTLDRALGRAPDPRSRTCRRRISSASWRCLHPSTTSRRSASASIGW